MNPPTEICPHFDVSYAKENFSYCNDDECDFSHPPPPPPPNGREDLWDLQYCKLWGWSWTRNRNLDKKLGAPTKKVIKKQEKSRGCFAICCGETDSLKNNSTSKVSVSSKSPKPSEKVQLPRRKQCVKYRPKSVYLNSSNVHQNIESECFPPSMDRFPVYCPCTYIPCCCCRHVCCHPQESIEKPLKEYRIPVSDCHNATQTVQDACCRCTQTVEAPPQKRKKNIPLMYCPRRGCCCCSHWCSCVPCPQCYNLCNVKNNCKNGKHDETSDSSYKSEEKKEKPKENKNLLSVYPFLTSFNTNKLFLNDLIDPKEEIQYLKSLETIEKSNNECKILLNTIYDTLFLNNDGNNDFMCRNHSSTPELMTRFINGQADGKQNCALLNNFMEKHFEQTTKDCPSIKSLKEVGVNTEILSNMKETSTDKPSFHSDFKNFALNTDKIVKQELSTNTEENFTTNDEFFEDNGFDVKKTVSYTKKFVISLIMKTHNQQFQL